MLHRVIVVIAAMALSTGCASDDPVGSQTLPSTPPVSSQVATVVVTPETSLLTVGDTLRLAASTRDAGGSPLVGRVVAWSSDAPTVATVSATGLVTALSPGLVRLSALSEGRTGIASVTAVR